jgi:exodeoxyribonuclease V beta subunit
MKRWDPELALDPGITLLEASAGTGKTYNITTLVLRLVAEHGVRMKEIVVVTFTRVATAELRDRIRVRLAEAVAVLEGRRAPEPGDQALAFLVAGASAAAARGESWLRRLRDAQESFDECLISTIHGFCQRMLQQNAFESQIDFDLELVDDTTAIKGELVDDWLSRELHPDDPARYRFLVERCGFDRDTLLEIAEEALRDPYMDVLPGEEEAVTVEDWPALRDAFADQWDAEWAAELPQVIEGWHEAGVFESSRQRTYRSKAATERAAEVTEWLAHGPLWSDGPDPKAVTYFSAAGIESKLAEGEEPPTHAAIEALQELLAFGDRLAGTHRARFVHWLRQEFDARNRARRVQSYGDLMRNLSRVLERHEDDQARRALVQAIRERFRVALIDEFQDTDVQQWTIFRVLFGGPGQHLFLIGDPKQAIYAFRGANVHVYLEAKRAAEQRSFTMGHNFRSDQRLIDALNHVMDRSGFFGEEGIEYVPVEAAGRGQAPEDRLRPQLCFAEQATAPLQLRFVDQRITGAKEVSEDDPRVIRGVLDTLVPLCVADEIVALLESGTDLFDSGAAQVDGDGFRPLRPGDIAVLTRTGKQANEIQAALDGVGVPSVLQGADSVLASQEALDLQLWLEALASPGRHGPARTVATTRLFGRDAGLLAGVEAEDPEALAKWEAWSDLLARWRERFTERGFIATLRQALEEDLLPVPEGEDPGMEDVTTRLLRRPDGERCLTNLWHVAELVHQAESANRLGLPGLLAWLQRQRTDTTVDAKTAEMRLERDDDAVKVLTMHKAKGLQFSMVYAPYLWSGRLPGAKDPVHVVPRADNPAFRICDVREGAQKADTVQRAVDEARKDAIRLLYVAMTRARCRLVVHVGHINNLENSPVAPAFHGGPRDGEGDRISCGVARTGAGSSRSALWEDLEDLAAGSGAARADGARTIALSHCAPPVIRPWRGTEPPDERLVNRDFLRLGLDSPWRRHSYSALTRGKSVTYVAPSGEREGFDADADTEVSLDEAEGRVDPWAPRHDLPDDAKDVLLAAFPAGADAGTFLHEVFEHADFGWAHPGTPTDDGPASLRRLLGELLPRHGFDVATWQAPLCAGLIQVLRTPLRATLDEIRLCDIPRGARLDELRFDFPIAGGDGFQRGASEQPVTSDDLVRALQVRLRPDIRPAEDEATMREAYLKGLGHFGELAGFMTGSIDLVFRLPVNGHPQWFVVDYKSNRLDPGHERRYPVEHFGHEGMRYEMEQHHYYLQYHLYTLALHRLLRSRMGEAYDYDRDIGGVYYLFFRGMVGPDTPAEGTHGNGCFHDRPPRAVIEALDAVFEDPAAAVGRCA